MLRFPRQYSKTRIYQIIHWENERKDIFINQEDKQNFIQTVREKEAEGYFQLHIYILNRKV